ncbi:hypothetical protein QZH41_013068, partial [Actinostola sp. cb2023]
DIIRNAVNAGEGDAVIFTGSGCTAAVHKLIHALHLSEPPIVFMGPFAHHSSILPWKEAGADVIWIKQTTDGLVDLMDLRDKLEMYHTANKQLVGCFAAASNVTGILADTDAITAMLHKYGALACWDYATAGLYHNSVITPHKDQSLVYKDAIFLSTHKFVGGVGTPGILVAKKKLFKNPVPSGCGGGSVFFAIGHENIMEQEGKLCGRLDRIHLRRYNEYSEHEILRPGFVRLNLPYFMSDEYVQFVLKAIAMVTEHGWKLLPQYMFNPETGEWKHRRHKVFRDRKWLGSISYGSGHMTYPSPATQDELPKDLQDCLFTAERIFEKAEKAIEEFSMINDGDRVMVCLSGGKDSLSLLHALHQYRYQAKSKGIMFEIGAATVDPQSTAYDPRPLIPYLASLGVPYFFEQQGIIQQAAQLPACESICSFCSRMKRGRLYACARREGYNVLAMGQHLDDLTESFLMSAFHNGLLRTMKANYTVQEGDLRVIRPLVFVREKELRQFADKAKLPVIAENCPACFEAPK